MPRGNARYFVAAFMALVAMSENTVAKEKSSAPSRRPASLSALSAHQSTAATRDFRRIGNRKLPSGGATEAFLADDSVNSSSRGSGQLTAPRITLPQDRTMPRQGTLSPQYNYTDVNIQFR